MTPRTDSPETTTSQPPETHRNTPDSTVGRDSHDPEPNEKSPHREINWLSVLTLIIGAFVAWFGSLAYIDARVAEEVSAIVDSDEYREELARSLRPSLIFDGKGSIISDQGAEAFLSSDESFDFERVGEGEFRLQLHPTESLDQVMAESPNSVYFLEIQRGEGTKWTITARSTGGGLSIAGAGALPNPSAEDARFRLELIP